MSKKKVCKLSKKAKKELDSKQRNVWNLSPVTRIAKSKRVYSRKGVNKVKAEEW